MYDLCARYYREATGRFWTRDPLEGAKCLPLTLNPYVYTWQNPVNRIDPSGLTALVEAATLQKTPTLTASQAAPLGLVIACVFERTASSLAALLKNPLGHLYQTGPCDYDIDSDCTFIGLAWQHVEAYCMYDLLKLTGRQEYRANLRRELKNGDASLQR